MLIDDVAFCCWQSLKNIRAAAPVQRTQFGKVGLPPYEALKALLLREWDPIGVADIPAAADEYDSYAMQVFTFLARDADAQYIADYLTWVVTDRIGMGKNPEHDRVIAEKAVAIHLGCSRI